MTVRTLSGCPEFITAAQVQRLLQEVLGFSDITRLRSFRMDVDEVSAQVYALNEKGERFVQGGEIAVDTINIPVRWADRDSADDGGGIAGPNGEYPLRVEIALPVLDDELAARMALAARDVADEAGVEVLTASVRSK